MTNLAPFQAAVDAYERAARWAGCVAICIRTFLSPLCTRVAHRSGAGGALRHQRGAIPAIRAEHAVALPTLLGARQVKPLHGRPAHWHIQLSIGMSLRTRRCDAVLAVVRGAALPDAMVAAILA
jgi:hypothetical protein